MIIRQIRSLDERARSEYNRILRLSTSNHIAKHCEAALAAFTLPAYSENWVRVHDNLWIDAESMFTDEDGYTRFKSRELDGKGTVMYQHREAIHCSKSGCYFRKK